MPLVDPLFIRLTPEGLVGKKRDGSEIPVGVMRNGEPALLLRMYEDERENCEHCHGILCFGDQDDDDDRCGRCNKSHRECSNCGEMGAETCIGCDTDWCEGCWDVLAHSGDCDRFKAPEPSASPPAPDPDLVVHSAYMQAHAKQGAALCGANRGALSIDPKRIDCPACIAAPTPRARR